MLAYLASRPVPAKRQSSPNALLLVISAHVALVAAVMAAKMDLPQRVFHRPPIVLSFPKPPPPAEEPTIKPRPRTQPRDTVDHPSTHVPLQPIANPPIDPREPTTDAGPLSGGGTIVIPEIPKIVPAPVRHDARLLTPTSELKPPYPASKLASEEEAVLTLRLTIDERGRVVAVEPVGRADATFLEAARRHLMAHWRYQPATDDGRAVASSLTITLRFQLDS